MTISQNYPYTQIKSTPTSGPKYTIQEINTAMDKYNKLKSLILEKIIEYKPDVIPSAGGQKSKPYFSIQLMVTMLKKMMTEVDPDSIYVFKDKFNKETGKITVAKLDIEINI